MGRVYEVEEIEGQHRGGEPVEADFARVEMALAADVVAKHGNHAVVAILGNDLLECVGRREIPICEVVRPASHPCVLGGKVGERILKWGRVGESYRNLVGHGSLQVLAGLGGGGHTEAPEKLWLVGEHYLECGGGAGQLVKDFGVDAVDVGPDIVCHVFGIKRSAVHISGDRSPFHCHLAGIGGLVCERTQRGRGHVYASESLCLGFQTVAAPVCGYCGVGVVAFLRHLVVGECHGGAGCGIVDVVD